MLRGLRYLSTAAVLGAALGLLIASCSGPGRPTVGAGSPPTSVAAAGPTVPAPITHAEPEPGLRLALQAARDRWRAAGPTTYEHELIPRCRCDHDPSTARVIGGRLIGPPPVLPGARTVEDWFDVIEAEIGRADRITARFDGDDGVPLDLMVDPDLSVAGDEYGFETTRFTAVTDPLQRWFRPTARCGGQIGLATVDAAAVAVLDLDAPGTSPGPVDPGLRFGPELGSTWCPPSGDDAHVDDDTWPIAAAAVKLEGDDGSATLTIAGAVAVTGDGTSVDLGSAVYDSVELVAPDATPDG